MSTENKRLAALTAFVVPLVALLALWPQVQPFADWLLQLGTLILQKPSVRASLTGIAVGVVIAGMLPHLLPGEWSSSRTKWLTRLLCFVLAFVCCYRLSNPHTDFERSAAIWNSLMTAGFAAAAWTTLSNYLYKVASKPESLK